MLLSAAGIYEFICDRSEQRSPHPQTPGLTVDDHVAVRVMSKP